MSKTFKPSPQQASIFDWITNGAGSALVEAVAGAGKTTTLVQSLELMVNTGRVFLGAYNKKIATEIKEKATPHPNLFISTFHAAGFGVWRKVAKGVEVNSKKCLHLYRKMMDKEELFQGEDAARIMKNFTDQVIQLVSYAKQAGFGVLKETKDKNNWQSLINHFGLDCLEADQYVIEKAQALFERSVATDTVEIDFDDMILAPLIHNAKLWQYDWVLLDEAQDTNATRRALALRMLKKGGRLVAVGDRHQAIYGFTGADSDALDLISKAVNAKPFPLTVSYRCPKTVVEYARSWVNHIEAHPDAPDGVVRHSTQPEILKEIKIGDVVLCRFNAPLVSLVYQFISEGIPAKVEGREIGNNLKQIAQRFKVSTYEKFQEQMDAYAEKEITKYKLAEQETRITALEDKVSCLYIIMERAKKFRSNLNNPVNNICEEIDSIFSDEVGAQCILLSSIHKSKGREWWRVYWMQTGPSKYAKKDWELVQEDNLKYVAATRAMNELILFPMPERKKAA